MSKMLFKLYHFHCLSTGAVSSDRLRARSLSSVPDGHSRTQEGLSIPPTANNTTAAPRGFAISESPAETDSSSEDQGVDIGPSLATLHLGTGRVYAAHSLPSHIWNLNGKLKLLLWTLFIFLCNLKID
jgi:E3 ubiquitin-protein ligase ZNRF1/2